MRNFMSLTVGILFFASVMPGVADEGNGRNLHDQNCLGCHGTEVYTREDRLIQSMDGLTSRVDFCARNAVKVDWDQKQIDAVANYLDNRFYHF
jgi:mono/diheme cytochrome c family protein